MKDNKSKNLILLDPISIPKMELPKSEIKKKQAKEAKLQKQLEKEKLIAEQQAQKEKNKKTLKDAKKSKVTKKKKTNNADKVINVQKDVQTLSLGKTPIYPFRIVVLVFLILFFAYTIISTCFLPKDLFAYPCLSVIDLAANYSTNFVTPFQNVIDGFKLNLNKGFCALFSTEFLLPITSVISDILVLVFSILGIISATKCCLHPNKNLCLKNFIRTVISILVVPVISYVSCSNFDINNYKNVWTFVGVSGVVMLLAAIYHSLLSNINKEKDNIVLSKTLSFIISFVLIISLIFVPVSFFGNNGAYIVCFTAINSSATLLPATTGIIYLIYGIISSLLYLSMVTLGFLTFNISFKSVGCKKANFFNVKVLGLIVSSIMILNLLFAIFTPSIINSVSGWTFTTKFDDVVIPSVLAILGLIVLVLCLIIKLPTPASKEKK